MNERMQIGQFYTQPIAPIMPKPAVRTPSTQAPGPTFREILDQNVLKFSHHAETRLKQRGIHLQQDQLAKLELAIEKAAAKGAKDSLMLMNDMAFIVNVTNRTVVTALDGASMRENVFTKIDSAVIIN